MYEDAPVRVKCYDGIHDGTVVSLERSIGLSIVDRDDSEDYLLCVHCAGSPIFKKGEEELPIPELNESVCDYVEACIRQNMIVDLDSVDIITLEMAGEKREAIEKEMSHMSSPDSSYCVFSQ